MTKNRSARRIDLDYNKDLKYPDVNEYLKDSMYASNLTQFPDNPANTLTFFRAIPNTITTVGTTLSIGTNLSLKPFLAQFKLYGYLATLEAVDRMEIEFDFLNGGNEAKSKIYNVPKVGGTFNIDITQNSEIKGLKLPTIVNFSIYFPIPGLVSIFDYIFKTSWKEAYNYFLNDPLADEELLSNPEYYSRLLWLFVRRELYTLDIPAKLRIYYINAEEPGAILDTIITLDGMLPQYRSQIDLENTTVDYNFSMTAALDAFNFEYKAGARGKMRIKGYFTGSPKKFQETPMIEVGSLTSTEYKTSLLAKDYAGSQHSGYDVSFPSLTFTYDYFINDDTSPIIDDFLFDSFTATPRLGRVDGLIVHSYSFGHVIKKEKSLENNPFKFSVEFTSSVRNLASLQYKYKFQLFLRSEDDGRDDRNPINYSSAVEAASIFGDFLSDLKKTRRTTELAGANGTTKIYKASAVQDANTGFLVYSQRNSTKNNTYLKNADLVKCSVVLKEVGDTDSGMRYRLEFTWPQNMDERALYMIAKCSYITLSISNYFQSIFLTGRIKKASYDTYYDDTQNPLLLPNVPHYPKFQLFGFNNIQTAAAHEREYLQTAAGGVLFANAPDVPDLKSQTIEFNENGTRLFSYRVLNYLAGYDKDAKSSNPFFMEKGYIILRHAPAGQDWRYSLNNSKIRNLKDYYESYVYEPSTDLFKLTLSRTKLQNAVKSILALPAKAAIPKGFYSVYVVTGLIPIAQTTNFNLYTMQYVSFASTSQKFYTGLVFVHTFTVS